MPDIRPILSLNRGDPGSQPLKVAESVQGLCHGVPHREDRLLQPGVRRHNRLRAGQDGFCQRDIC